MFEAYTSTYNGNARKAVGFTNGYNALQIGNIIYTKPTGSAENGGTFRTGLRLQTVVTACIMVLRKTNVNYYLLLLSLPDIR